ncbi:hypothetical protein HRbin10_02225 [bacterium HR10]|nr:hypothetical protein HRbin10_02225 [bacterium HR10]
MDWITLLVSAVVSALVSVLFGPFRAKREEAARRDLIARREVARLFRKLRSLLKRELFELENPREPIPGFSSRKGRLSPSDVDKILWEILQALNSPDLNRETRDWVYNELKRLAGARIEVLKIYPPESLEPFELEELALAHALEELEKQRQKGDVQARDEELVRNIIPPLLNAPRDPALLKELIRELDKLIEELESPVPPQNPLRRLQSHFKNALRVGKR